MPSDKEKRFFVLIIPSFCLLFILSLLEISSYFILVLKQKSVFLQPVLDKVDSEEVKERFFEIFSYDLGWEPSFKVNYHVSYTNEFGYRGDRKNIDNALICLFGDSYTVGSFDIEKSWPYLLEKKAKRPVLNFGVGGYGTDQAYWRFEKRYIDKLKTPYVCLVIMSENIARIVIRYPGFYARSSSLRPPKPMYYKEKNGKIVLLPNPLKSPDEIVLLKEMPFIKEMGQKDYWYNFFEQHGFNQRIHFPYSYFLLKQLPFSVRQYYQKRIKNNYHYKTLYNNNSARSIMEHIILKFIHRAAENDTFPIILFLPNWIDFIDYQKKGETVYHDFYLNIKRQHHATFDGMDYFTSYLEKGEEISLFFVSFENGHLNSYGEQVISEGFYRDLLTLNH
jgi:hypothetical protein